MKIETILDTPAILANQGAPVHLALRFTAPQVHAGRSRPIAFGLVLDRSGSMQGPPLEQAREACKLVVKNLRKDDLFSLSIFDDRAMTLLPLQPVSDREEAYRAIDRIDSRGSTNLTGGWMLGRDQLARAPKSTPRRILLLTDGLLNTGIIETGHVKEIVSMGLETHGIRTSCLGFGPGYNEDLLDTLSTVTGGTFYDATQPDVLPDIFDAELEGLQTLSVQNLRVRLKRSDFCESAVLLSDYPMVYQPPSAPAGLPGQGDSGVEITIGDLVSEEQRTVVLAMEVLPIPLLDGRPATSLEGEKLLEVELQWDEVTPDAIVSNTEQRTIRVQPVQNRDEVVRNTDIIPFVAAQHAGRTVRQAMEQVDRGQVEEAMGTLKDAIRRVETYGTGIDLTDALNTLHQALRNLDISLGGWVGDSRKAMKYRTRVNSLMSTHRMPSNLLKIILDETLSQEERIEKLEEAFAPTWVIGEAMKRSRRGRRKGSGDGGQSQPPSDPKQMNLPDPPADEDS